MRTNIEIDDVLIQEALRISGLKTKRATVKAGLKALIRLDREKKILAPRRQGDEVEKTAFLGDTCR